MTDRSARLLRNVHQRQPQCQPAPARMPDAEQPPATAASAGQQQSQRQLPMTFLPTERETRLQRALRLLAESEARVNQHSGDLTRLMQAGDCVRAALTVNRELREKLAQCRRDVIRARDRIRFGLDEPGIEPVSLELSTTTDVAQTQSNAGEPHGLQKHLRADAAS